MTDKPKGYWSSVFFQATQLMQRRRHMNADTAFWLARDIVDKNLGSDERNGEATLSLPFRQDFAAQETFVLAP
jgi:hypothetical protein